MNLSKVVFVKIPRKLFRLLFDRVEYLHYRFFYTRATHLDITKATKRYFFRDEPAETEKFFRKQFPNRIEEKIVEAELICEHVFDLLGSGPKKLSKEGKGYQSIEWHSDFKSRYRWNPQTFFRSIRFGHKEGVDIKVPWELSRFQHLVILGEAYLLNENEKYAQEFVNQVTDWIEHNPVGFGVNWYCPMDVAIRAVNWLVALEYFSESNSLPNDFLQNLYSSVYNHGAFIRSHLETKPVKTNHYLADIAGLFFISIYCPFFKESKKWQRFAVKELEKEIRHQVYPDGCNFEASTSYHRLALEMLFYCELLAKRSGVVFSAQYQERLKKMFDFSLYCVKPNGRIPQIGDNDSGRFLVFCKRPVLEHKYLLSLAAIYYEDPAFKVPDLEFDEEAFWVFGEDGLKAFQNLPLRKEPITSRAFPDAGWYIMRQSNDYCFVSCGPNGQDGKGGHAHNDRLSFELMLDGEDVILDPGTYVYTPYPEWRNNFRSTAYHNTVQVDGIEQNDLSKGLFMLEKGIEVSHAGLDNGDNQIIFEGEINYPKERIAHSRKFILSGKEHTLQVIDHVIAQRQFLFEINFCLAPDNEKESKIEFQIESVSIEEGSLSTEYGKKEECTFVRNKIEGLNGFENLTRISQK